MAFISRHAFAPCRALARAAHARALATAVNPVVSVKLQDTNTGAETEMRLHTKWLREQCGPVHESTQQRLFDVSDYDGALAREPTLAADGSVLEVAFPDGEIGRFDTAALAQAVGDAEGDTDADLHKMGWSVAADPLPKRVAWGTADGALDGGFGTDTLRRFDWARAGAGQEEGERALLGDVCTQLLTHGAAVVRNVPRDEGEIVRWCGRVGPVRTTDWGVHFDVRTVQAREGEDVLTEDVAYTNEAIDLHHDNPYRHPTPGYWCLHCLQDAGEGGGGGLSLVSDGLHAALLLRERDPAAFDVLTRTNVAFKYRSSADDVLLQTALPHIVLGARTRGGDGHGIDQVAYSGRLDALPAAGTTAEALDAYYAARSAWLALAREHALRFKLAPGDLVLLDNTRVMHGRTAIAPPPDGSAAAPRFMQGCYMDHDGVSSHYYLKRHRERAARAAESSGADDDEEGASPPSSGGVRATAVALEPLRGAAARPPQGREVVKFNTLAEGDKADFDLMTDRYVEACGPSQLAARTLDLLKQLDNGARQDSAEHFSRLKSLPCTAMGLIFIPAYCFAIPRQAICGRTP